MEQYIKSAKTYITDHKKQFTIGAGVVVGTIILALVAAVVLYNSKPHYSYQPVKACDLLTPAEAQDLLGDRVISTEKNAPAVVGDVATSKCGYTDENPDANQTLVAAVAVRSAVNDKGVAQNKSDFTLARSNNSRTIQDVKDLGESAYFNNVNNQLNVLSGHSWIILNYGIGSAPETNTIDKAIELAHKVLN